MTRALAGEEVARQLRERYPDAVQEWNESAVWIAPESTLDVAQFLKETAGMEFSYLNSISAVDFIEYFEIVYHLTSFEHNHSTVIKTRVYGREEFTIPSVVAVWPGADYQEREIWDSYGYWLCRASQSQADNVVGRFPGAPVAQGVQGHCRVLSVPSPRSAGAACRSGQSR